MQRIVLMTIVAFALTITVAADFAEAFGGRGYARRQTRRARRTTAAVVYRAPVRYYSTPVVTYPTTVYPTTTYPSTIYHAPVVTSSQVIYHDNSYVPSTSGVIYSP